MGIVLMMGFLIFLAFCIPALVTLVTTIVFFVLRIVKKKKGMGIAATVGLVVTIFLGGMSLIGLFLMLGPLSYGGII